MNLVENAPVKSDGTSSGALAADRLRMARRRAIERLSSEGPSSSAGGGRVGSEETGRMRTMGKEEAVRERGLSVTPLENPVVKNDGTSSGALAADRLRMARRRALASLGAPEEEEGVESSGEPATAAGVVEITGEGSTGTEGRVAVKERGLSVTPIENPAAKNDGTSSGALAADRLRMARRKALASLGKPEEVEFQLSSSTEMNAGSPGRRRRSTGNSEASKVRERGIVVTPLENPVRANDGTSSGALAADRLRMARRRALEGLKK